MSFTCTSAGFFAKETQISRALEKGETSRSVFQAIKTMVAFHDYSLDGVRVHPSSASKAPPKKKNRRNKFDDDEFNGNPELPPRDGGTNLAASLNPWDCDVYDCTDRVLLLTTTKYPSVIVKLQNDPRMNHIADEMANEAAIYEALEGNRISRGVIPRFMGTAVIWVLR